MPILNGTRGPLDVSRGLTAVEVVQARAHRQVAIFLTKRIIGADVDPSFFIPVLPHPIIDHQLPRQGDLGTPAKVGLFSRALDTVAALLGQPAVVGGLLYHDLDGRAVGDAGEGIKNIFPATVQCVGVTIQHFPHHSTDIQSQLDGVAVVIALRTAVGEVGVNHVEGQVQVICVGGGKGGDFEISHYGTVTHPRDHVMGVDIGGGQTQGVPVGQVAVGHIHPVGHVGKPRHGDFSHGGIGIGITAQIFAGGKGNILGQLGGGKDRAERQKQGDKRRESNQLFHSRTPFKEGLYPYRRIFAGKDTERGKNFLFPSRLGKFTSFCG